MSKIYGKLTEEHSKTLYSQLHTTKEAAAEFSVEIKNNPEKFLSLTEPWAWFYELPFNEVLLIYLSVCGLLEPIIKAVKSETPYDDYFHFTENEMMDRSLPNESDETITVLLTMLPVMKNNITCLSRHSTYLNNLVEKARTGDDQSLFEAVYIDRTVTCTPTAMKRISEAEIIQDAEFFSLLSKALNRSRPKKPDQELDDARYMIQALSENIDKDDLIYDDFYQLIVNKLELYSEDGADPYGSFRKFFNKQIKKSRN